MFLFYNFLLKRIRNLLEEICSIVIAKKGYGVGEHPDVSAAAVVIRLRPAPVLVSNIENLVRRALGVSSRVVRVRVVACNIKEQTLYSGINVVALLCVARRYDENIVERYINLLLKIVQDGCYKINIYDDVLFQLLILHRGKLILTYTHTYHKCFPQVFFNLRDVVHKFLI